MNAIKQWQRTPFRARYGKHFHMEQSLRLSVLLMISEHISLHYEHVFLKHHLCVDPGPFAN